jgi:PhnB protein
MMRLNAHLTFNGQCEAAFQLYEKCLGGKIVMMMTYGDSPMAEQTPPGGRDKILHATFAVAGQFLTGGDATPEEYQKPQGVSVLLHVDKAAEADRIFEALSEMGAVQVPIQETFWAARFGMAADRFGIPWIINGGNPA